MGYEVEYRGVVRCDPVLTREQRGWLRRLREERQHVPGDVNAVPPGVPGYWCPWRPARAGHLALEDHPTKEHMPGEWLRWLVEYGPWEGRPPALRGVVHAFGRAPGDRWRLRVREERMAVERDVMPCVACWLNCRDQCAPGAAYRFDHPDPVGNGPLDGPTDEAYAELLRRDKARCRRRGFRPLQDVVDVVLPPPAGSPPPVPPFQERVAALLEQAGATGFEAQARIRP